MSAKKEIADDRGRDGGEGNERHGSGQRQAKRAAGGGGAADEFARPVVGQDGEERVNRQPLGRVDRCALGLLVEATGVKETGCLDSTKRGLQPALEDFEQLHGLRK